MNDLNWGLDVENSIAAVFATQDGSILARMADDVIAERVRPCIEILRAFAERRDLPLGPAYRLAKAFPRCHELAARLCSRSDATPEMLDEWAEDRSLLLDLATNPNTRQSTIDRLTLSAGPTDIGYCHLLDRVSLPLLETLAAADANPVIKYFASARTDKPELLRRLAFDPDLTTRCNVASNRFTASGTIMEMVDHDEDVGVLLAAAVLSRDERVLDRLADRLCEMKSGRLAVAILGNRHASDSAKAVALMITTD